MSDRWTRGLHQPGRISEDRGRLSWGSRAARLKRSQKRSIPYVDFFTSDVSDEALERAGLPNFYTRQQCTDAATCVCVLLAVDNLKMVIPLRPNKKAWASLSSLGGKTLRAADCGPVGSIRSQVREAGRRIRTGPCTTAGRETERPTPSKLYGPSGNGVLR